MPTVPVLNENQVAPEAMSGARRVAADYGSSGEIVGKAVSGLGQAATGAVDARDKINEIYDEAGGKQLDNQGVRQRSSLLYGPDGYFSQQGSNALNARDSTMKALNDINSGLLAQAKTPRMRSMLSNILDQRMTAIEQDMGQHAQREGKTWANEESSARQTLAGQSAITTTNPDERERFIATGLGELNTRYAAMGLGGDVAKAEGLKFESGVHKGVIDRMITGDDLDGAVAYRDAHKDRITASDSQWIASALHDPLQRREDNAKTDTVMGAATGGDATATFSYADPLHGAGHAPVPGGQFNADRDYGHHQGADLPAPLGSSVFAATPGVAHVSQSTLGGNIVTVDDGQGNVSKYMHLGTVGIKDGDTVTPDTKLGSVGMTGRSTGPHLYFEIIKDGQHVDPEKTIGQVQQAPERHDLNTLLARVDAHTDWTPEQRDRVKIEVQRRVGRDEQLQSRVEEDAQRQALDVIDNLGGKKGGVGFTDMAQLPASIRNSLSPASRLQLMTMAQENAKAKLAAEQPDPIKADGPTAFNLHMQALYDPDGFKRTDLRMFQNKVTPGEMMTLAEAQAHLRTAAPEGVDHGKIWGAINRGAPELGLDLGSNKGIPRKPADRATGMRIFSMMHDDLAARVGQQKRQPTDDEVSQSYDRAVRMVVVDGDTAHPRRAYDVLSTGPATAVPDIARQQIMSAYQRHYRRLPNEGEIARTYAAGRGQ